MPPKKPQSKKPEKKPAGKTAAGKSRPSRKSGSGGSRRPWRLFLLLLAAVALLVGLIWLARREEHLPVKLQKPAKPPVATRIAPPREKAGSDQTETAREQVEAFLAATAVPAEAITREPPAAPRHYQVHHRPPSAKSVDDLRRTLRKLAPPLALVTPEDGVLTIADGQGKTLLTVQYAAAPAPPKTTSVPVPVAGKGRVAIIVDDLGRGLKPARELLMIRQPVTFAVLAIEPHATEVADMAHAAGREVMLHVPMEPQGYPVVDPGDDALLVNQSDQQLRKQLQTLLSQVPHAVGINNHMGSRFTEDARAMAAIMAELKSRGLFFVDSLTSGHSQGTATASQAGVPVLRRDVFLDNVAEVEAIAREIRRLADKASQNGGAIGICHPYPETIKALQLELPKLAAQGVEFVRVGELLEK